MAAAQKPAPVLATAQKKRTPITQKDDVHMQQGNLLLSLQHAPSSLERLLSVAKLSVSFLADLLRRSEDAQDTPLLLLGHHYLSHRVLQGGGRLTPATTAAAAAAVPPAPPAESPAAAATAAAAPPPPGQEAAGSTTAWSVYVQEICTFDGQEGPKTFVDAQGLPQAILQIVLHPTAYAKSKRLGRELSIKVTLQPPPTASGSSGSGSSGGSSLRLLECGEDYAISWPALHFLDPVGPVCTLGFKGDLEISCPQSGLFLTLTFSKDHGVRGSIEQTQPAITDPATTPTTAADSTMPAHSSSNNAAAAAAASNSMLVSSSSSGGGRLAGSSGLQQQQQSGKPQVVGSLEGSWMGVIHATCPQLGLEGVVYDVATQNPAPVPSVDLRHMGPMRLSRFWSAVHDALLYADPRVATGGRAAAKLASTMSHFLTALTLDSAAARDVMGGAGAAMTGGGPGSTAGGVAMKGGAAAPSSSSTSTAAAASSVVGGTADPDLDEFDRQAEGLSSGGGKQGDALNEDSRSVPPCYKAQHAAGNKLRYQLHYTLTAA